MKQAMLLRDKLRKQKKSAEYKQQCNLVDYLVREAQEKYFQDLAGNKVDISSLWRAINTLTKALKATVLLTIIFHLNSTPDVTPSG